MAKTAAEAEADVYRRMFQFKEQLEEEGFHADEITR